MFEDGYGPNYRRGLILGLTLAEVFLLLLFLLLLISSYLINEEKTKQEKFEESLIAVGIDPTDADFPLTLVAMNEQAKAGASAQGLMGGADLSKLPSVLQACSSPETTADILNKSFGGQTAVQALETCETALRPPTDNEGVAKVSSVNQAKTIIRRLTAENLKLRDQLKGNGLELPPCWPRPGNLLRPAYTYDVTVLDVGLSVKFGDSRSGQDLSALKLNGPEPSFTQVLTAREFLGRTKGFYDWSVAHQCRFFVRLLDGTSATNKAGYKKLRRTVETNFYIADIR